MEVLDVSMIDKELDSPRVPQKIHSRFRSNRELKLTALESPSSSQKNHSKITEDPSTQFENFLKGTGKNYRFIQKLGSGRQGTVFKLEKDGKFFAAKTIHTINDEEQVMTFESEYNIIKELDHEFLPKFQELLECPKTGLKCLVTDFFEGVTLKSYLENEPANLFDGESVKLDINTPSPHHRHKHSCFYNSPSRKLLKLELLPLEEIKKDSEDSPSPDRLLQRNYSLDDRLKIFKNLLKAIEYLHAKRICHRDLNLENILINERDSRVRIIDFGLAKCYHPPSNKGILKSQSYSNDFMMTPIGFIDFRAPEVLLGDTYSEKVDVWTCGIIFLRMFGTDRKISSRRLLKQFDWENLEGKEEDGSPRNGYKIPKLIEPLHSMVNEMLQKEPKRRISASKSLEQLLNFLEKVE